jgi:hypothetical protein
VGSWATDLYLNYNLHALGHTVSINYYNRCIIQETDIVGGVQILIREEIPLVLSKVVHENQEVFVAESRKVIEKEGGTAHMSTEDRAEPDVFQRLTQHNSLTQTL